MKKTNNIKTNTPKGVSRRDFVKTTAFVGGCAAVASQVPWALSAISKAQAGELSPEMAYELAKAENIIYSTCLQCHVACPIKCKIWDGTLAKIDGSPYSPQNYLPHLPLDTDLKEAAKSDGKLCTKGQTGIQTYYDPYRIRKVLKRKGPRGANEWEAIEWNQFIDEVVNGGKLFSEIGDDRHYPGFDEVYALRDVELSKKMAADSAKVAKDEMSLEEFQEIYSEHLDKLIDPNHPDLGPKNNEFVFNSGRMEHGRKEISKWFTYNSFCSQNRYDHFSICEESHHIAYSEMTHHKTHHLKPDLSNSEFVIFWGTGAFSANFGLTPMAEKVTTNKVNKGMKTAVVDPRLSNDAAKADWWLPVKPGTDGALGMAMLRWMIENNRFDEQYLTNANKAAASEDKEPTWTNGTHLVRIVDGHPQKFLRASEVGKGSEENHVVSQNGTLVAVDYHDEENPVHGDLFVDTEINGEPVKSSMQLIKEQAFSKTMAEYVEITGISAKTIAEVARELTSHGKKAAVEFYRGPCQHTDGYYASAVLITLNLMIGNPDWKGGLSKGGSHWHEFGGKPGNIYSIKKPSGGFQSFGVRLTREGSGEYENSTLFRKDGYPAKRPWYPLASGVYQEIFPSMAQGYPYKCKIMFLHKGTPAFAIPASGYTDIKTLMDHDALPLHISCDIVIGETSMYADYILPDLTYLERWGTPHVTPDVPTMTSKVRQPVAAPLTEEVEVDGEKMPISMEAFLIAIGKKLNLPGFGKDAFGEGLHHNRPEDFFLKAVANMAYGDKEGDAVPDASDEEMELFRKARRHLPKSVFDEEKWKKAVEGYEWRKIVYVLNRGGRYAPFEDSYDGKYMKKKLGTMFYIFSESMANRKNAMSGKYFHGIPIYVGQFDALGNSLVYDEANYPFIPITYKEPIGGHSRTISNYWGNGGGLQSENKIWINTVDAERLGIKQNQRMRLVSPGNPEGKVDLGNGRVLDMIGRVDIKEGVKPGVLAISAHYGHWAYGSNDVVVDGVTIKGDKRRAGGISPNPILQRDPVLKDVVLTCPIGASSSYYDSRIGLEVV